MRLVLGGLQLGWRRIVQSLPISGITVYESGVYEAGVYEEE